MSPVHVPAGTSLYLQSHSSTSTFVHAICNGKCIHTQNTWVHYTHKHACMHTRTHVCAHTNIHTCTHTRTHPHPHTHTHIHCMHIYIGTLISVTSKRDTTSIHQLAVSDYTLSCIIYGVLKVTTPSIVQNEELL